MKRKNEYIGLHLVNGLVAEVLQRTDTWTNKSCALDFCADSIREALYVSLFPENRKRLAKDGFIRFPDDRGTVHEWRLVKTSRFV